MMLNRYIPVRTGEVSADAADYLKEVTEQMVKVNYSPAEQKLADFYIRAQLKRASEDDYIREEEREKADIREDQARKEEREKSEAEKVELLQQAENEKIDITKKLLAKGLSVEDVAESTNLDYSVINKLI